MTTKAIAARERRVCDAETKRFNTTMKEFIEIKYDSIYEEYSTFYNALIEKHPRKRNLLRTSTFIEWKKRVIEESFEKDGVTVEVTNMIPPDDTESESEGEGGENLHERFIEQESAERGELPLDQLESAEHIIDGELPLDQLESAEHIIDQIIEDLERDGEARQLFEDDVNQRVDEGIELDYEIDIMDPFDYELE